MFWRCKPILVAVYVGVSVMAFLAYALDKSAAKRGSWRTSESMLHLLGLLGGRPGALLAQQWMRHKSSKPSFVAAFWFTVFANMVAFVVWHIKPPP